MTTPALDYIWDIETYPNMFCLTVKQAGVDQRWYFEISDRRNDIQALCQFIQTLRQWNGRMVGFNNLGFDYPVLHSILLRPDQATAASIYTTAQHIICGQNDDNRFGHIIWDRDQIVPQLDLFKIHHFDNKAKMTSLKILEFNMRSESVQDLPIPVGTYLISEQMDVVARYNSHDVDETEQFYWHSIDMIRFREELSVKYGRSFINHNDTKVGKDYFIMRLEEAVPGACYESTASGSRRPRQTLRADGIALRDVIFPYIQFQRPEFIRTHRWLQEQVITNTKDFFKKPKKRRGTDGSESDHYEEDILDKRMPPCVIDRFKFVFGTGGLHGSVAAQTISSSDSHVILDLDVASYYPNLAIANSLFPEHLGQLFPVIYKDVYDMRVARPKKQYPAENAMLKLALNGVYGDSNNPYSPFFDPQYTMSITINGQLLLCVLAEHLMNIPGLQMIQVNTDGVTVRIPRTAHDSVRSVCKWWEGFTCLELEEAIYDYMHIRDTNAYVGRYSNGKIKRKGPYRSVFNPPVIDKGAGDLEWHQNHSALVIPKAVESVLIYGGTTRDFIYNHDDVFDFMLRTKIPRSSRLVIHTGSSLWPDGDEPQQNVCRYYVSRSGGAMTKIMPPLAKNPTAERRIGICVGWNAREANDIRTVDGRDIDFEYYIGEAEKLLRPLQGGG